MESKLLEDIVRQRNVKRATARIRERTDTKRLQFLRKSLVIGMAAEIIFLVTTDLRNGVTVTGLVDLVVLLSFVMTFVGTFITKSHTLLYHLSISVMVVALASSFYNPSALRSLFLMPLCVLVAYLFLSRVGGMVWTVVIFLITTMIYALDKVGVASSYLESQPTISSLTTVLLFSTLLYVYEGINVGNEQLVAHREKELSELNDRLSTQLLKNRTTSEELERTLMMTQKNNTLLRESKLALMNVLEDANNLQKQIQREKENVEKKVQERTSELRLEQARLRASLNGLESGILMTFDEDQEAMYNPAFLKLFELETASHNLKNIKSKDIIHLVQSLLKDSFNLKEAIEVCQKKSEAFHADGVDYNGKLLSIIGAPIFSTDSKTAFGCVIVLEDKTESLMLERSKDEFISIASHELRTPLTAIRGNASMLVNMYGDRLPDGDIKEMVSDIKDASVRLIGIVNQFLSTSRLEQKRAVFNLVPVDILHSLHTCMKELEELAHEKNLEIISMLPEKLPRVMADEARTGEIIINVLGNAIKYTNQGSVTVKARENNGFVEVDIEDTGIGIEPKNQGLLFHKFQQTTSNILTRDDSRSTGLGLYITKLLTEQMGGNIYLKTSKLGHGSIFTFSLPIAKTTV